jgi:geranylgeranyl reductase family protein
LDKALPTAVRTKGLRIHVGRRDYLLEWPTLDSFPNVGIVCRRSILDQYLAEEAVRSGAQVLTGTSVATPILSSRGRITGVTCKDGRTFSAPVIVEASGNSARLAVAMGLHRMTDRPMGVAVRTYFRSPHHDEEWLDSWLELWDGKPGRSHLLPGYGWSFPMGDGTCNVGLGLPDAYRFRDVDYKDMMRRWLATMPPQWGFTENNQTEVIRSAALPMGFNRKPTVLGSLMLVGDAAGAINSFNGEGVSYAMESGRWAAEAITAAKALGFHTRKADQELMTYSTRMTDEWGSYFWAGNLFSRLISHPAVMKVAAHYGLPIPFVRQLTHRMLAHLWDGDSHDVYDRILNTLTRLAPVA